MKVIEHTGLRCKSCKAHNLLKVEQWSKNLYLGSCTNENHASSIWLTLRYIDGWGWKWEQTAVNRHPEPKATMSSLQKQEFDKLQTPFWKLMGQKATKQEEAEEKELKRRGMTYGDAVLERSKGGENTSGINRFNQMRKEADVNREYHKA